MVLKIVCFSTATCLRCNNLADCAWYTQSSKVRLTSHPSACSQAQWALAGVGITGLTFTRQYAQARLATGEPTKPGAVLFGRDKGGHGPCQASKGDCRRCPSHQHH